MYEITNGARLNAATGGEGQSAIETRFWPCGLRHKHKRKAGCAAGYAVGRWAVGLRESGLGLPVCVSRGQRTTANVAAVFWIH